MAPTSGIGRTSTSFVCCLLVVEHLFATLAQAQVEDWLITAPRGDVLPDDRPPASFEGRDNIIFPAGTSDSLDARPALLQSNKFYSNFLIDGPARAAWTLPYIVAVNDEHPFGLSVAYPRRFDGEREDDRLKWYATTTTKDIILTAEELYTNQEAVLSGFDDEGMSAIVTFTSSMESAASDVQNVPGSMKTWLVRGMAYTTVEYDNYSPEISSIHAIVSVNGNGVGAQNHTSSDGRFVLELNDGTTWILYSSDTDVELYHVPAEGGRPSLLKAVARMSGTLRVTRVPYEEGDAKYDDAIALFDQYSGSYPIYGGIVTWIHRTNNNRGRYWIEWTTAGDGSGLLHYSLPHHQDMVSTDTVERTGIYLASPTKGDMELLTGTQWIVENTLPDFEWIPSMSGITDPLQLEWITYYLESEIQTTLIDESVAGGSIYFGAKHLMAYTQLCLVAQELGRADLVATCLDQVEEKFDLYLQHENGNALVYDQVWGGIIGEQGLEEDNSGADFYSVFYNDHHFHYSYLINVAAVLAHLRDGWIDDTKVEWVNTLLRDVNSPDKSDPYFPQFRAFDWFSGHSWARGLLFAFDGKDQESTSEDVNFYYAMTMWGIATENEYLEGLGRLQTAVVTTSINEYFLLKDSNTNHPPDFVKNKVTGIFFESKVDYTTWFGANTEYIHGIQNIPVTAITESVREPQFCQEEWDQRLASVVEAAEGNWDTVLYMSYATIQKNAAFKEMLMSGVDDGIYRAWALYWAATRPECDIYCSHDEVDLDQTPAPTPAPFDPTNPDGPFNGVPAGVPGTIEAEEFDYGGPGVAYSDTDPGNNGGTFRTTEGVDISAIAGGGYSVGWLRADEWMKYTVDVTENVGSIVFSFNVASPVTDAGKFRLVTGGTGCDDYTNDLSGEVVVPFTGGWEVFEDLTIIGEQSLSAGETEIWLCVVAAGFNIDSWTVDRAQTPAPTPAPIDGTNPDGPFNGVAADIPGTIEAEEFDYGGPGVAYSDTDPGNNGGAFRTTEEVDISAKAGGGYNVGWLRAGEWMKYTVDVTENVGSIVFSFNVASPVTDAGKFRLVTGGTGCDDYTNDLSGEVVVPFTGGWGAFEDVTIIGEQSLSAGETEIWLCVVAAGFNIDSWTVDRAQTPAPTPAPFDPTNPDGPFNGVAADIPGTIEAEEFDYGGPSVAYSDTDPGNNGGAFRTTEGVDISAKAGGGYNVGWLRAGEWMKYTVDVTENVGSIVFSFNVASPVTDAGKFRLVTGGTGCDDYTNDLSGEVVVPFTGGWGAFEDVTIIREQSLSAGETEIWLCVVAAGFNIDSWTVDRAQTPAPTPAPIDGTNPDGPFNGVAADIPGTIEAEEFDYGGPGVAYSDTDPGNNGGAFRTTEEVDIAATSGGGYNVGWLRADEWMKYTVDVTENVDPILFSFDVASPYTDAGKFRLVTGGTGCDDYTNDLSGEVVVPFTGGWGAFEDMTIIGEQSLSAGETEIWLCVVAEGFNIDSWTVSPTT